MPVILAHRKLRQEKHEVEAILENIERAYLKQMNKQQQNTLERSIFSTYFKLISISIYLLHPILCQQGVKQ
jgi:hypothetical protein